LASSSYEPNDLEIGITLGLGLTLLSPYYLSFVNTIGLTGKERVLEFGSGSGICSRHIAHRLTHRGGRLDCIDVSSRWMKTIQRTLRRYENVNYYLGNLDDLDLEMKSYDLIVSHYALHKVPIAELSHHLFSFSRLLNTRGRVVFREPMGKMPGNIELEKLAKSSGLRVTSLKQSRLLLGDVMDGVLKLNFCGL
jgi:ubiquinone/menaquinone biosynthesis C-methylase UbiE